MYKPNLFKLIFSVWVLLFSITTHSQNLDSRLNFEDSTQVHILTLKKGGTWRGRVLQIRNNDLTFLTQKNQDSIYYTLAEIYRIKVGHQFSFRKRKFENPAIYNTHLLHTPTAFNLKKGDKSYRTYAGMGIIFDYGLGNGFSVGAAFTFPFMTSANIKMSGALGENYRMGLKATLLTMPFIALADEKFFVTEIAWSQTFGSPDYFVNLGVNYYRIAIERFFFSPTLIPKQYFSISAGGGWRFHENWQLLVEKKMVVNQDFYQINLLPSVVLSWFTKKNNIAFGFHSTTPMGLNFFPVLETGFDDIIQFDSKLLSKLPFLSYSKIF